MDAIRSSGALTPEEAKQWEEINREYSLIWPNITQKKDALSDAEEWDGIPNKFEEHFSPNPGIGD